MQCSGPHGKQHVLSGGYFVLFEEVFLLLLLFELSESQNCVGLSTTCEHLFFKFFFFTIQVNEFSVEPPGHSDDEYEIMAQAQQPAGLQTHVQPDPDCQTLSQTELSPRRPLSLDLHSRHTKSLSLPYITSPIQGPEDSCSEDEVSQDDSYPNDYSSDEDESMFIQSLPPDFFLNTLSGIGRDTDTQDRSHPDQGLLQELQSTEDKNCQSPDLQLPAYKETATGDEEQGDTEGGEDEDGLEDEDFMRQKDAQGHDGKDQLENNMQR